MLILRHPEIYPLRLRPGKSLLATLFVMYIHVPVVKPTCNLIVAELEREKHLIPRLPIRSPCKIFFRHSAYKNPRLLTSLPFAFIKYVISYAVLAPY